MTEDFFSYELLKEISSEVGRHPVRFYKRTRLRPEVQRRFSENDIRELLILAAASGASVLPRRYWDRFTRYTSSLRYRHQYKKKFARFAKTMRTVFLIDSQAELEALFRSHHEMIHRRRMMLAIDRLASRRNPEIDLRGADLLRAALEQGNGAIVWAFQFSNQSLAGKRALWEQGFRPVHVSSYIHGFSDTKLGNAVINALLCRTEDRYLKQRVHFGRDDGPRVTRKIVNLLDRGDLISMTNNTYSGNMFVEMPIGENGYVSMPTAPLSIVVRRKTPLFSMAILETEPFGRMEAVVKKIHANENTSTQAMADRRDYKEMARLALTTRDHLFEHFSRAPDQFLVPEGFSTSRFADRRPQTVTA